MTPPPRLLSSRFWFMTAESLSDLFHFETFSSFPVQTLPACHHPSPHWTEGDLLTYRPKRCPRVGTLEKSIEGMGRTGGLRGEGLSCGPPTTKWYPSRTTWVQFAMRDYRGRSSDFVCAVSWSHASCSVFLSDSLSDMEDMPVTMKSSLAYHHHTMLQGQYQLQTAQVSKKEGYALSCWNRYNVCAVDLDWIENSLFLS